MFQSSRPSSGDVHSYYEIMKLYNVSVVLKSEIKNIA
jgi:hypothetical protein